MKKYPKMWGVATIFVALTGVSQTAAARGWCNVDHLGGAEFRSTVAAGASRFYQAVAALWSSFAEVEAAPFGETGKATDEAKKAIALSTETVDMYRKATTLVDFDVGKKFANLDMKLVASVAEIQRDDERLEALNMLVRGGDVASLLERCSSLAGGLKETIGAYIGALEADAKDEAVERSMWAVFRELNRATYEGRYLSAIFLIAGKGG